ncbi:hypothetical protein DFH06DRAFT_1411944 [Mycena polygramma]|nr:hypothetical protein DFH06DRAFT_1411944 [Mycena polygramma]
MSEQVCEIKNKRRKVRRKRWRAPKTVQVREDNVQHVTRHHQSSLAKVFIPRQSQKITINGRPASAGAKFLTFLGPIRPQNLAVTVTDPDSGPAWSSPGPAWSGSGLDVTESSSRLLVPAHERDRGRWGSQFQRGLYTTENGGSYRRHVMFWSWP